VLFGSQITVERNEQKIIINVPDSTYRIYKTNNTQIIGPYNYNFTVDSVMPNSNAQKAGIQKGDKFISVNNENITSFGLFTEILKKYRGTTANIKIERQNNTISLSANIDSVGKLGFLQSMDKYKLEKYTFAEATKYGTSEAFETIIVNAKGVGKIFEGKEKVQESLQGPIGMAKIYGGTWGDWYRFWRITGLISMILAVMNILPIPALDGGHVIFLTIEVITGKKFSDKFMENAQMVGMILLLSLMVFVIGNDIYKLF
jgi:regulator of sigma E protease